MEPSQETSSSLSGLKPETLELLKTSRVPGKKKYDWTMLKAEWLQSDDFELSSFFASKQIARNSYSPNVKGWIDEKEQLKQKALVKAKKNGIDRFTSQARLGRLLRVRTGRLLNSRRLDKASVAEINQVLKTSLELERGSIQSQPGPTINFHGDLKDVKIEIKELARHLARSASDGDGSGPTVLGEELDSNGGEQPV